MALPRNGVLALDMLPHLARCAKARQTITYTELGELIGHPAFFLSGPLDYLRDQILLRHDLPRLDALVVNAETKEAGASFYADGREQISDAEYRDLLESERQRVFERADWDSLVERLQSHYGGEEYARLKKQKR